MGVSQSRRNALESIPGVKFSIRKLLRVAIILLGLQLHHRPDCGGWRLGYRRYLRDAGRDISVHGLDGEAAWRRPRACAADRRWHIDLRRIGGDCSQHGCPSPRRGRRLCGGLRDRLRLDIDVSLSSSAGPSPSGTESIRSLSGREPPFTRSHKWSQLLSKTVNRLANSALSPSCRASHDARACNHGAGLVR